MKKRLFSIYQKLYKSFGPQHWWPAETDFEVAIGAILTQNTSWLNVERAISNLKKSRCLTLPKLLAMDRRSLARLIKPAGYYNIKARRLKNFLVFLDKHYQRNFKNLRKKGISRLRSELLCVNGIGEETADSIILYALHKPVFVVDAYTKRIALRHNLISKEADYQALQRLFMDNLPHRTTLFNEYHALLVKLGKDFCKKTRVNCSRCPLHEKK